MELSSSDLLVGLFPSSVLVWRVSTVRGRTCTRLHFLPDVIPTHVCFTAAAWTWWVSGPNRLSLPQHEQTRE